MAPHSLCVRRTRWPAGSTCAVSTHPSPSTGLRRRRLCRSSRRGFALAVAGRLASLCHAGALVCAAVGTAAIRFARRSRSGESARRSRRMARALSGRRAGDVRRRARRMVGRVVDLGNRQVIAGVDRFAIRPLCFSATAMASSFASRADEVPGRGNETDPQAIYDYVYHHFIPAPRTIFKGVSRLDAAHRLIARAEGVSRSSATGSRSFASTAMPFPEREGSFSLGADRCALPISCRASPSVAI